jgi:hypothetical protein
MYSYTLIDVFNPISHCDATNLKAMLVNGKLMCGALTLSAITHPPGGAPPPGGAGGVRGLFYCWC